MKNSDRIWQWSRAGKKLFFVSKIHSLADALFVRESGASRKSPGPSIAEVRHLLLIQIQCQLLGPAIRLDARNPRRIKASETSQSHFEIEEQKPKSEILFPVIHLLADVAVRCLENDVVASPENSLTEEKGIRKAIFTPTGLPFLQKRVPRIAKSLSAANAQAPSMADNICKVGVIKQIENEAEGNEDSMAVLQVRCSKRSRSQALPSKCRDFILQPWK